jgi:hypothetical protein
MEIKKATQYFYSFSILSFSLICAPSSAQEIDPSTWNSFVAGSENTILRDTFKVQTFAAISSVDEWPYEVSGNTELFNPSDEGITDAPDGYALKMKPGSRFDIRLASIKGYTNIYIQAIYAAWKLMQGEILLATANRSTNPLNKFEVLSPPHNNYSRSFTEVKKESAGKIAPIIITSSPSGLQLDVTKASGSPEGFYALDSVYAYGSIQTFSLFTGTGLWDEPARWSHQPVFRHRKALINGHVAIDKPVFCNQVYLGNGSLDILPGRRLDIDKLIICGENASFSSSGEAGIKDGVTVYRTFPSKGCWYFVSFPFDVYAEGIDPGFKLMDDTPNNGGNYFYLYTYNGEKRSLNNTNENNWEVVPAQIPEGRPIFEQGKGYLIALDEMARTQILSFSSTAETISSDFGKTGKLSIPVSAGITSTEKANQGWYLCGNPLPCPLPVKSIISKDLDGYIYVYNGNAYEAYALYEDYAIPPFSAFFVKAKSATEIQIHSSAVTKSTNIITMAEIFSETKTEPRISSSVISSVSPAIKQPNSYLKANSLFLENLSMPGVVYVWDAGGRLHWKKEINAGSSIVYLPSDLPTGNYIVRVDMKNYKCQHKFIWN